MSGWIIASWVFVLILTAINGVIFFKLKQAAEQMMKVAFPGAKNMQDAMGRMQQMMQGMGGGGGRGGNPFAGMQGKDMDAKLKQAMQLLQQQNNRGPRR